MTLSEIHHLFLQTQFIAIDTRKIEPNSFFVAIKGERFDANTFAQEALQKGAQYVIIDNPDYYIDSRTILVKDSLKTLQDLAAYHRKYLGIPVIALTGSNGKTTTKELLYAVLSQKYKTTATVGNLNNHIGVPLTLLSFKKDTQIGIVEMGANHQKEIDFLCRIARPDFGYITNFGKAHLEGFGGVEGVIKGKSEMYDHLIENNKKVFINLDDPIQDSKTRNMNRITFSTKQSTANLYVKSIVANPLVSIKFNETQINSNLIGIYNANNINAAVTIGHYFGLTDELIKKAIESYIPENNRSQLIKKGTNKIILDAYNANPSSMAVALDNFIQLEDTNKIIILGDMFELGNESSFEHNAIVNQLKSIDDIKVYYIGNDFYNSKIGKTNFNFFKTFEEFISNCDLKNFQNNTILIKGSRGMALEKILNHL